MDQVGSDAAITLVEGASFCLSRPTGDLLGETDGLYVCDVRVLSRLAITVNGRSLEPLTRYLEGPASVTVVNQVPVAGNGTPSLVVVRRRHVSHGLRDDVTVRNIGAEPAYFELEIELGTDLADADDVRNGVAAAPGDLAVELTDGIELSRQRRGARVGAHITFTGSPNVSADRLRYEGIVAPHEDWTVGLLVAPIIEGAEVEPRYRLGDPIEVSEPARRLDRWRAGVPIVETDDPALAIAIATSADDLGHLRTIDPEYPERAVAVAAVPWHLGIVGRDALLTAWMGLIVDPDLALGTLETMARFQGSEVDERTEEEPGRILHRMHLAPGGFGPEGGAVSFGSIDATPLFVMLLGELRRWGLAPEVVERLLPHADRALDWIEEFGDRDGDGFVEYQRSTDHGVANQSWKDTDGAIRGVDGRIPTGAIAPAEVQGYVYAAYLARSHFAVEAGDAETADRYRRKAAALKAAFNDRFWVDERGWLAMALDGDKHVVDALASNIGHCLWTGILDEDKAEVVAKHLTSPDLFSGWGVRTLAASMRGYNPLGMHIGAVWPHDSAICAAGLMRYGFVDDAHRVVRAGLDAAAASGGRTPVLSGFDRDDLPGPVPYPETSSIRAWSAAAPLSLLRTMLRLDPWIPSAKLWLAPTLPPGVQRLHVDRIPLMGGRITVHIEDGSVDVEGLPSDVELVAAPRAPLTAATPD